MSEVTGEIATVRALIVNRLRGNGGHRGAGELADDVLNALGLEQVGWMAEDPASRKGYDLYVHTREDGDEPVYRLAGLSGRSTGGVS